MSEIILQMLGNLGNNGVMVIKKGYDTYQVASACKK